MAFLWDFAEQLWDINTQSIIIVVRIGFLTERFICSAKYTGDVVWHWFHTEVTVWKEEGGTP